MTEGGTRLEDGSLSGPGPITRRLAAGLRDTQRTLDDLNQQRLLKKQQELHALNQINEETKELALGDDEEQARAQFQLYDAVDKRLSEYQEAIGRLVTMPPALDPESTDAMIDAGTRLRGRSGNARTPSRAFGRSSGRSRKQGSSTAT